MSLSNYLENELLDHVFKQTAYACPTTIAIALSTADPSDSGANIAEPGAGAYGRVLCATDGTDISAASAGETANVGALTFPQATAPGWGTITHMAIYDATAAGNMLAYGTLTTSRDVTTGDTVRFAAGDLDISMD